MTTTPAHEPSPVAAAPMILDGLMPRWDATRVEHRVIDAPVEKAWDAVLHADFLDAWRQSTAVRALFAVRGAGEWAVAQALGREHVEPPEPETLRLADMPARGEWVMLGTDAPREAAFGAAGRFWSGETAWLEIDAAGFAAFAEPGAAKIGCNFSLRPYGDGRTLVSYEARTLASDDEARRHFLRYWRLVTVGIGVVMRSQLRVVAARAGLRG